jgi:asparagine synthase (glutamine-hydrolysing)
MSAIAGIYQLNGESIPLEHSIGMMKVLEQFPANDIQTLQKGNIFLGSHAQWITPESIGEQLPFYDYERQLGITADAIIDNREELFERLQVDPGDRKKITDSQLILLAYYKWGEECPKFLIGDFAFMIWDEKEQKMFGARDFSGNRTLYYYQNYHVFTFCTTIQPLLSLPYVEKRLNEQWIADFLAIPNAIDSVDPNSTVYKNIHQLPPAHSILIGNGKVSIVKHINFQPDYKLNLRSNQDYEEAFLDVFQTAVSSRLRTHRNVGSYLSGGLDSGSVVSLAAKVLQKENKCLNTFSYIPVKDYNGSSFPNRIADESIFIKSTVQHVGNISDHYLDFEGKSPLSEINELLDTLEMPYKFFGNSFWLKGIFETASQKDIGVLLNGQRGNYTISWGPAIDYYATLLKRGNLRSLINELNLYCKYRGIKKSRVFSAVGKKAFPILSQIRKDKNRYQFPMLINPDFAMSTKVYERLEDHGINFSESLNINVYKERQKQFDNLFAWNATVTSGTKLSLRHSLWNRDPTNDLRVVRFCLSVPEEQCVQNGYDRALIRRSMNNLLPDKVRLNQKVRGIQGADSLLRMKPVWGEFIEELQQIVNVPIVSDILNLQVINDAISKVKEYPNIDYTYSAEFIVMMRSLIVTRFIKNYL